MIGIGHECILSTKTFAKQITARKTVKFEKYNHGKSREKALINFP